MMTIDNVVQNLGKTFQHEGEQYRLYALCNDLDGSMAIKAMKQDGDESSTITWDWHEFEKAFPAVWAD